MEKPDVWLPICGYRKVGGNIVQVHFYTEKNEQVALRVCNQNQIANFSDYNLIINKDNLNLVLQTWSDLEHLYTVMKDPQEVVHYGWV